jgi:subtilisin family serine protease
MGFPGAYAPVISAGSSGWRGEWSRPGSPGAMPNYRMWWLQYAGMPLLPNSGEVTDATDVNDVYVSGFSSRALAGQQLDVLAPGSWVRGPFPGEPAYNHLPWWSNGRGIFNSAPGNANFFFVGGTSMASPHVASLAALMLQKNPSLTQTQVETIMKSTALAVPSVGSRAVLDFNAAGVLAPTTITWDTTCGTAACDPVGAGLIQADGALAATP